MDERAKLKEAFIALRAKGVPDAEILATYKADKIARTTAAGMLPEEPSMGDKLRAAFDPRAMVDDVGAFGAAANENLAFGLPAKAMDAVGLSSPELRRQQQERSPLAAGVGTATGATMTGIGGPEALAGREAMALTSRLAGGVGQMQRAAGAAGISNAIAEGGKAAVRGDDLMSTLEAAGQGGSAGALFGAAAEVPGGMSRVIRSSSPAINRYATARESGVLDRPAVRDLPEGPAGVQQGSEQALSKVVKRDQELGDMASREYHQAVDPELTKMIDRQRLQSELEARRAFETLDPDTGLPLNDRVTRSFDEAIDRTGMKPTVQGTLARRRALQEAAGFGSAAPSDQQGAARKVYQAFRGAVRGASPKVAAADDAYARFADVGDRRRDILFNTEDNVVTRGGELPEGVPVEHSDELLSGRPKTASDDLARSDPRLRVGKEKSAATTLSRVDDDNVPGLRAKRYLDELASQDPAFAQALEELAAKKAIEATRFSATEALTPTSLTGATSAAGFMPLMKQNSRAFGRVTEAGASGLDTALARPFQAKVDDRLTGLLGPGDLTLQNPVVRAAVANRERERERGEKLKAAYRGKRP